MKRVARSAGNACFNELVTSSLTIQSQQHRLFRAEIELRGIEQNYATQTGVGLPRRREYEYRADEQPIC